jgi:hypothetical protein
MINGMTTIRWNRPSVAAAMVGALALGSLAIGSHGASAAAPNTFAVTSPTTNSTVSSRTVTFAGTGAAGSTVTVLESDGSPVPGTHPAVVGANRAWTTTGTFPPTAPAGEHLTANQVTSGSANGSAPVVVNLPARPSHLFAITGPANNSTVPSRTVTFTGTGTPGSTVSFLDAGSRVHGTSPALVASNGIWSTTATFPATAPVTEHLTASQVTGSSANGGAPLVVHLPALTYPFALTSPADNATVASRTVTFAGTGTPGSTVSILDSGGTRVPGTSPATVDPAGAWSTTRTFAPSAPVTEHLVATLVTTGSVTGSVPVTIDLPVTTHPLAVTSPADNTTVASRTVTFTGTGTPGSTVAVLGAGGAALPGTTPATVGTDGNWSTTATFPATAPVTEHLTASQITGEKPSGRATLVLHLPAATYPFAVTAPADNSTVPSLTVTFTGTGTPGSTVTVLDAGGAALPGTTPTTVGTDGNWSLTATFGSTAPLTEQLVATQQTSGADNGTASLTIHLPSAPAISLSTAATPTSFTAPGQGILYRFVVTNIGNVTLTSVGLSDNTVSASHLRCPVAALAPGANETCTGTYTTTQADVDTGSLASSATASGTPPTGAAVTSPPSALSLPGPPSAPAITVTTASSRSSFTAPGQGILYRFVVTNHGNVTLTSIGVSDNKVRSPDLKCPVAALAPGANETCTGTYTTTFADVLSHAVVSSAVAQGTPPHAATPIGSAPSTSVVPLAVSPHVTAVAHKAPVSPAKLRVTG